MIIKNKLIVIKDIMPTPVNNGVKLPCIPNCDTKITSKVKLNNK